LESSHSLSMQPTRGRRDLELMVQIWEYWQASGVLSGAAELKAGMRRECARRRSK